MPFHINQFKDLLSFGKRTLMPSGVPSLQAVITQLEKVPASGASPLLRQAIQEAYQVVPYQMQQRYKSAFDYMKREITPNDPIVDAVPVDQKMEYVASESVPCLVQYAGVNSAGATKIITLEIGGFTHVHKLIYKASNGSLATLSKVSTRESVQFRTQPSGPPFNYMQASPMQFVQGGGNTGTGASCGYCKDDHSTFLPSLICATPRVAGTLIGEQWYEYSTNAGITWHHIPQAAYLIEKSVIAGGPTGWIFSFRKRNWLGFNPTPYYFEAQYAVQPAPDYMPDPALPTPNKGLRLGESITSHALKIIC